MGSTYLARKVERTLFPDIISFTDTCIAIIGRMDGFFISALTWLSIVTMCSKGMGTLALSDIQYRKEIFPESTVSRKEFGKRDRIQIDLNLNINLDGSFQARNGTERRPNILLEASNADWMKSNSLTTTYAATGRKLEPHRRVRDGTEIRPHSMPWLVAFPGDCTGSIIGKKHILTAAHCDGMERAAVGVHDIADIGKGVGHYIDIEQYNDLPGRDITVLTLKEEISFNENVGKAILAAPSSEGCSLCLEECSGVLYASGWGYDPINDPNDTHQVPRTTTKKCVKCSYPEDVKTSFEDTVQNMCAISDKDETHFDVCGGDSGGPLTKGYSNVIVAIVESGLSCFAEGLRLGFYQDMIQPEVQEFIRDLVPDLEIEGVEGH